jgi:hypothetical protein
MAHAPSRRQVIRESAIKMSTYTNAAIDHLGRVSPTRSVLPEKLSSCTTWPDMGASIMVSWPVRMPTWPGAVMVPSDPAKKTRSPGRARGGGDAGAGGPLFLAGAGGW